MKQTFTLKLGQQLTMTPALQQAIRLLQLSSLDLHTEIQQFLDSNPMLEREDDSPGEDAGDAAPEADGPAATDVIPEELPVDAEWEDIYIGGGTAADGGDVSASEYHQASRYERPSLREHLLWQAQLTNLNDIDADLAAHIIDNVDEDGYLQDWDALSQRLQSEYVATATAVERVLEVVQSFDPPGVAARDLRECLRLQLDQLAAEGLDVMNAHRIVDEHLDLLAAHDTHALAQCLELAPDASELDAAVRLIRGLQPRPGAPFTAHESEYVVPEVSVARKAGRWVVALNPELSPRIRINAHYLSMIRRADRSDDQVYLKQHLQEARYFLNSLRSRNETLLRVAQTIVEEQRAFLEYGAEAMKPLVLKDVAEKLDVHESTVSRATSNKYMHTPRGVFELKYFFSSHVNTTEGGVASATAIQAMIRRLIGQECPQTPLSDSRLTELLLGEGIKVARRTVAKYREAMHIAPSHERRRAG